MNTEKENQGAQNQKQKELKKYKEPTQIGLLRLMSRKLLHSDGKVRNGGRVNEVSWGLVRGGKVIDVRVGN